MKTLPAVPFRDFGKDLTAVTSSLRTAPRVAALKASRASALLHAKAYSACSPADRHASSTCTPDVKEAYLHCWDSPPVPVQAIKKHIREALPPGHQAMCPYCGLVAELRTFDHFLEKTQVPELAFYYRNLVPSCWTCNTTRSTSFDADGQRVLHAYDDGISQIPDVLWAAVEGDVGKPVAAFYLRCPLPREALLFARHFSSLHLAERYSVWAATAMVDLLEAVSDHANWVAGLLARAERRQTRVGPNDPTAALLIAMAGRPNLVAELAQ